MLPPELQLVHQIMQTVPEDYVSIMSVEVPLCPGSSS